MKDMHTSLLTVSQLAEASGITVRTLHHYDEIGLLEPRSIGANGYRYYGRAELLRLQNILFHRELGVPLPEIAALLDLEGEDKVAVLTRHREKLEQQRERYRQLIETIDRTIGQIKAETTMNNADLYQGFSAEKQAGYEAWLIERFGEPMRESIAQSRRAYDSLGPAEREALGRELQEVEQALVGAQRNGLEPDCPGVAALIRRHRAWVSAMWGKPCPPERYVGLADLYLSHPDFVARYESIGKGFAEYLASAMRACSDNSGDRSV